MRIIAPMPKSASNRPIVVRHGTLNVDVVRCGTGSQQRSLVLDTDEHQRLVLVKLGGPSFGLPEEASLAGRQVEARGYLLGSELRYTQLDAT